MKTNASRSGIALVVVLVFLVLLSVFIVGFFSNSQDELTAAQSFTGEVSASHLAESAVSVVMGQIREATSRTNGAWGSQPGMIRVYRNGDVASDKADAFFKLYSSNDMILSGSEISNWDPTNEVPEGGSGWNHQPAAWTDINEKVRVILSSTNGVANVGARYPILDPSLEGKVEGLEFIANSKADGVSATEKAHMPVRWLYVLKDGTLSAPATVSADGLEVSWNAGERAPTVSNPIVGRVAFWTDDETSKVNVNTAGGYSLKEVKDGLKDRKGNIYSEDNYPGAYWDVPRAYTNFDRGLANQTDGEMDMPSLALSQPVRGEFQRYPGHPSTTSLGILFRALKAGSGASMQDADYLLTSGQLSLLAPRLQYNNNSKDMSDVARSQRGSNFGIDRLVAAYDSPPGLRVKRLYASVDELFFAQPDPANVKPAREQSDWELGISSQNDSWKVLSPDLLEKMRFFLTAYSRAPEMNLWGRPRMTLWPVRSVTKQSDESNQWNASDRLIAFCSTIGPDASKVSEDKVTRFLMQRRDWTSPTIDSQQITRNDTLYRYLRSLTDQPVPGFGGVSFKDKYASLGDKYDRDQILTEMFDYIRVVNLRDSTRDKLIVPNLKTTSNPDGVSPTKAQYQQMESYRYGPRGLVVPLQFTADGNTTRGFGRFPTVSEVALVLYHAGYKGDDGKRYFLKKQFPKGVKPVANLVRAFLVLQTFNPMQGFAPIATPNGNSIAANQLPTVIEVDNLNALTLDGKNLGFPTNGSGSGLSNISYTYSPVDFWNGRNLGGNEGFFHTMARKNATTNLTNGVLNGDVRGNAEWYNLQSTPGLGDLGEAIHPGVEIPFAEGQQVKTQVSLNKVDLVIRVKFNGQVTSSLNVTLPEATVPVPYGGQDGTPSADDPYAELRTQGDKVPVWQSHAGGFLPSKNGLNPTWAANKETIPNVGPYTEFPCYVKSFAGRMAWIMNAGSSGSKNAESGQYIDPAKYTNPVDRSRKWQQILQPGDVVRSVTMGENDFRRAFLQSQKASDPSLFKPHPDYSAMSINGRTNYQACSLRCGNGSLYFDGSDGTPTTAFGNITSLAIGKLYSPTSAAALPLTTTADTTKYNKTVATRKDGQPGDFDTGLGNLADGPFCNKADEGNLTFRTELFDTNGKSFSPRRWQYTYPYFDWTYGDTFDTFFTPNRQVPSAVLFGSLLAGKTASWQTLSFSPNPAGDNHPGRKDPKDFLWLDLFSMPVVEPYAISEPFSTAGKINMNYQIVPFSNIKRNSGMRAALQPVRVTAYPAADATIYNGNSMVLKVGKNGTIGTAAKNDYRYVVDRDETLKAFDYLFSQFKADPNNSFFKSAAQICDMYLYPRQSGKALVKWNAQQTAIKAWWKTNSLTGDNVREKPYADLYPRLTTKSNTYCVHVRAQALRQSAPPDPKNAATHYLTWSEKRDRVIGEYRGASIIERYIDPQDERFYAAAGVSTGGAPLNSATAIDVDKKSLDSAYRFRVLNTKRFDP